MLGFVFFLSLVAARKHKIELKGKGKCPLRSVSRYSSSNDFSSKSSSSSSSSYIKPICAHALKEAIHVPDSCAYRYLKSIAFILKDRASLLFTDQLSTVIFNFESEFKQVNVTVYDAFGQGTKYEVDGLRQIPASPPKYSNTAKTYLNFDGFTRDTGLVNSFYYTFDVWNRYAQFLQITLSMSIDFDPIFC